VHASDCFLSASGVGLVSNPGRLWNPKIIFFFLSSVIKDFGKEYRYRYILYCTIYYHIAQDGGGTDPEPAEYGGAGLAIL
jgi:hypothetical protein